MTDYPHKPPTQTGDPEGLPLNDDRAPATLVRPKPHRGGLNHADKAVRPREALTTPTPPQRGDEDLPSDGGRPERQGQPSNTHRRLRGGQGNSKDTPTT